MITGYASILFAALFLAILILLHFLKPEIDPIWRMISEYEIGRYGWLMRVAFFCWGASVLTLLITIWPSLSGISGTIGRWWLGLIVIALFGAGIFKTNAITDPTPSLINAMHTLCGAIVILTFPIVATLVAHSLLKNNILVSVQGQLIIGTILVWIGMIGYFASIIVSRMINPSAERVGPEVYQGWPNRFLVVTYIIWLIIVAANTIQMVTSG